MRRSFVFFLLFLLTSRAGFCQDLLSQVKAITSEAKGIVGVSIIGIESGDTLNFNAHSRLVLHSVIKFPIALTVLDLVDKGKFKLDDKLKIRKSEMAKQGLYSPLRDQFPEGTTITLGDLLGYMISQSDNVACDYLLKKIGGPQVVEEHLKNLGISGVSIRASEEDMASAWEVQYTNWGKTADLAQLLDLFYKGKTLSQTSTDFLIKLMTATTTGPKRLKGLLPANAVVAHKTGTSPTNSEGLSPATNDIGIITLPNGKHLAIAVLVCNSTDDEATREAVIARISKAAWDFYGH